MPIQVPRCVHVCVCVCVRMCADVQAGCPDVIRIFLKICSGRKVINYLRRIFQLKCPPFKINHLITQVSSMAS